MRVTGNSGIDALADHEASLANAFLDGIDGMKDLRLLGPARSVGRVGVFSVRLDGFDPQELSAMLEAGFGILTRSGIHCAPLIHEALGTLHGGGTTRLSVGPYVSTDDMQQAAAALGELAATTAGA